MIRPSFRFRNVKNNDRYDLNPDFQREYLWDVGKQSRLIESCVMRIPLPVDPHDNISDRARVRSNKDRIQRIVAPARRFRGVYAFYVISGLGDYF
jgi:hypothetical protein